MTQGTDRAHAAEDALDVTGLTVAYDSGPVLWNVSMTASAGRLMAIVGPNGAGKSTLLKAILGLLPRVSGRVRAHGIDPADDPARIAYVPQRATVDWDFPATVLTVVTMGTYGRLGWFRRPGKKEREAALHALRQVDMVDYASRQISELSGGQQQRVFLARALVQDADVYLMDEPFAGVDSVTERSIVTLLKKLRDEGSAILCVHHDLSTVTDYFDDITLLRREVVAQGPVERVFTRENVASTYGRDGAALLPDVGDSAST
ncbi:MAG: metal ABC transporter ATP-binding protein [Planctomycetota bacterium]